MLTVTLGCGVEAPSSPPPNVLVILVDCLRADRVGRTAGESLTPNIDRLAADGIRFENAFSPATWTKPSIASLFTALYPGYHGLRRVALEDGESLSTDVLPAELETMAEVFHQGGYATGAVINQVHLQSQFGFDQGFEHFQAVRGRRADWLNGKLLDWLDGLDGDRPFFGYLHYLDAHWPYARSGVRLKQWRFGPPPPRQGDRAHEWLEGLDPQIRADAIAGLTRLYDRGVKHVDTRIGELLRNLEDRGADRDTIIIVTSDHGEGFDEHGRLQHGYAPFEEVIHVPLVIRLPQSEHAGTTVAEPVSLVDVLPTLAELANLPTTTAIAGRSLVPLWERGHAHWPPRMLFSEGGGTIAVRARSRKLIVGPDSSETYDLAADPGEQQPLDRQSCGAPCDTLHDALDSYRSTGASAPKPGAATLTEAEIEELRDLGYL